MSTHYVVSDVLSHSSLVSLCCIHRPHVMWRDVAPTLASGRSLVALLHVQSPFVPFGSDSELGGQLEKLRSFWTSL